MKFIMILLLVIFNSVCFGQKKDSIPPKPDSTTVIMNEFLGFLQDKLTVKEYLPVQQMVSAFLQSKEFTKPQKPKK